MAIGGQVGYFTGDPLRLLEDIQILKPDVFPSVPRILNRIYQASMAGGNVPGIKGKLFNMALSTKLERLHTVGEVKHALWDRLVFRKARGYLILILFVKCNSISADSSRCRRTGGSYDHRLGTT